jgi:carboxymethylenebutenolidase
MEATIYIGGAKDDASFDDDAFALMSDALTAAGVTHTLVTYPAAHGFAVPDNPTFDADAAERHWQALEALYASALV